MISKSIYISVLLEFVFAFRNRVGGACRIMVSGSCGMDAVNDLPRAALPAVLRVGVLPRYKSANAH